MPELVYLKGLPGSGKTTLAREKYPNHYRVNKDDIRAMLYGDAGFTRERERETIAAERSLVVGLMSSDKNIVVDNTGFGSDHESFYRQECKESEYTFRIEDLSSVPLHECLTRNAQRTGKARVPDKVIHDMWAKHIQPKLAYPQDPSLPPCIIIDIDGTIAQMDGRGPFEWDKVGTDKPRTEVIENVYSRIENTRTIYTHIPSIFSLSITPIFLSGRDSVCYDATYGWIVAKTPIYPFELHMRPTGDSRSDYIVKRELWEQHIKDKYRVVAVFDDRPSVLRLWRELGFTTFDVGNGVEF